MKLAQLETFVVVAEELHFRRAAERLFTQPSTVSTQISQLEAEYGTQLFIRNSRNVELSPAGEALLEKARHVLAGIADLEATARELARRDQVRLSVGMLDEGLAELTDVVANNWRLRFPSAQLAVESLDYDHLLDALDEPRVDVVITVGPKEWFDPARVTVQPLFTEPRLAVLPRRHPLAGQPHLSVEDLLGLPFVWLDGLPPKMREFFFLNNLRDPTRSPDVAIEANHMQNLLSQVAHGRGTFTVTHGNVRFFPRPEIAYVPVPDLEHGTASVVRRVDDTRPHVLAFIEDCVNAVQTSLDLIPTAVDVTGTAA